MWRRGLWRIAFLFLLSVTAGGAWLSSAADVRGAGAPCPGPDDGGYRCFEAEREYITGDTPVAASCSIFGSTTNISLPFAFNFYGVEYTSARVSCFGNLQFATSSNDASTEWPNSAFGPAIAALAGGQGGDRAIFPVDEPVFTKTVGTTPNRTFVVEWRVTRFVTDEYSPPSWFQIQLDEATDNVYLVYGFTNNVGATLPQATAGIQKGAVTPNDIYLTYLLQSATFPEFTAVCFTTAANCDQPSPPVVAPAEVQLCLQVDGSASISSNDFALVRSGLAAAIGDSSVVPQDGTIELTVVQFSTYGQLVVPPTLIDSSSAATSVASAINSMTQLAGNTSYGNAVGWCAQALLTSPRTSPSSRQVFNIATDGQPTALNFAFFAREIALDAGIDEINAEALGSGVQPGSNGFTYLLEEWVYPQDGYQAPPFSGPGFVIPVANYADFEDAIAQKLGQVLSPPEEPEVQPPVLSKTFGATSIFVNGSTSLAFSVSNPNSSASLSGVGFTDTLPSGLVVQTPNGLSGSCGGGTITAAAGSGSISLGGATLAAGGSCQFSVNVRATSTGLKSNVTGDVTSNEAGDGNSASDDLQVNSAPSQPTQTAGTSTATSVPTSSPGETPVPALTPIIPRPDVSGAVGGIVAAAGRGGAVASPPPGQTAPAAIQPPRTGDGGLAGKP